MADLISRAAAIEICKSIVPNTNPDFYNLRSKAGYGSWMHSNGEVCATTNIEVEIEKLPAVDAAPVVHAWWRELKDGSEECTNCLGLCPHEENYNGDIIFNFGCEYCPWCGAKMDGERRDDDAADN